MRRALIVVALLFTALPARAQRTASNPLGAQLNVQDAGTCSTTNSFAWQVLPANAGTTTLNLSGTFIATITVRESNNGGGSWSTAATLSAVGTTTYATNGFTDFCADVTAFTSGIVNASIATGLQQVIPGSSALAGTNGQLLFNNNGVFGATSGLTWNGTQLLAPNGNGLAPPYSFSGATGAGMLLSGTNPVLAQNGSGILTIGNPSIFSFPLQSVSYGTTSNCSSSASPAVCASAASGSVTVAAAATTEVVNTTAVTANSQIQLTFDSSLGTKLAVTCNTTITQATVSARTAATSFTITVAAAPVTNPACFSYTIIN